MSRRGSKKKMRPKPSERQTQYFVAHRMTSFLTLLHDNKALKYYHVVKLNS